MAFPGTLLWSILGAALGWLPSLMADAVDAMPQAFAKDYITEIKPVLQERCYSCHGALRQKGGLRLDTAELARKGGRHGTIITPGEAGEIELIRRLTHPGEDRMPPECKPLFACRLLRTG